MPPSSTGIGQQVEDAEVQAQEAEHVEDAAPADTLTAA